MSLKLIKEGWREGLQQINYFPKKIKIKLNLIKIEIAYRKRVVCII